jgi:hypothetical protein
VDIALFAFIMAAGLAIASFCAGWIAHEQHDRD